MRRNLGWFSIVIPTVGVMLVATFHPLEPGQHMIDPGQRLVFAGLILSFVAGLARIWYAPLRTPALKWIFIPAYMTTMPFVMFILDVAMGGFDFFGEIS